jgi:hypothetical protein
VVRPLEAVLDGDVTAGQIDQAARNEERRDAARATLDQGSGSLVDAADAADAGADQHARGALLLIGLRLPARIAKGLGRGCHRIDDEGVDLALLLGLHPFIRIEGAVGTVAEGNLAGDLAGQIVDLEVGNLLRAALPLQEAGPCGIDPATERCDHAKTCNNNPAHNVLPYH